MKKCMSMILAVMLVILAAGCSQPAKDPKEVYKEAVQKTSELKSVDMDMDMELEMSAAGEKVQISMDNEIQVIQNEQRPQMAMEMDMDLADQGSMSMDIYYVDGYMYMDVMGQKMKLAAGLEDAMQQVAGSTQVQQIEDEAFKDIQMSTADNVTTLTYTVDGPKMADYVSTLMAATQTVTDMSAVEIEDITGTITVNKEGYMTGMSMMIPMSMTAEGVAIDMTMEMDIIYNNPGQDVMIEFPDFTDYVEVQE